MNELIDQIIVKLNPIDDALLIGLLNTKKQFNDQKWLTDHEVSKKEIDQANNGIHRILNGVNKDLLSGSMRFKKAETIYNKTTCSQCKFSINKTDVCDNEIISYKSSDLDTDRCIRCYERCEYFINIMSSEEQKYKHRLNEIDYFDISKCKALIIKITKKLKEL